MFATIKESASRNSGVDEALIGQIVTILPPDSFCNVEVSKVKTTNGTNKEFYIYTEDLEISDTYAFQYIKPTEDLKKLILNGGIL